MIFNKEKLLKLLIPKLKQIVSNDCILSQQEELEPYECDGLSAYRQIPLLVVLPESINQVQSIVKLCNQLEIPLIARGAGTGLSGGALPRADAVLLSLSKFNK